MDKKLEIVKDQILHSVKNDQWILETESSGGNEKTYNYVNKSDNIRIKYRPSRDWDTSSNGWGCRYSISIKTGSYWSSDYNAVLFEFSKIKMWWIRRVINSRSITKERMKYLKELEYDKTSLNREVDTFLKENKQIVRDSKLKDILED